MCVLWWAFRWLDFEYVLTQPSTGQVWMTCFLLVQFRFLFGLSGLAAALEPLFFFGAGADVVEAVEVTSPG